VNSPHVGGAFIQLFSYEIIRLSFFGQQTTDLCLNLFWVLGSV
jgi:hypothetical protein